MTENDLYFGEEEVLFGTSEYGRIEMAQFRAEVLRRREQSKAAHLKNRRKMFGHRPQLEDFLAWGINPYARKAKETEDALSKDPEPSPKMIACFFCKDSTPFAPFVKIAENTYCHVMGEVYCADLFGRGRGL